MSFDFLLTLKRKKKTWIGVSFDCLGENIFEEFIFIQTFFIKKKIVWNKKKKNSGVWLHFLRIIFIQKFVGLLYIQSISINVKLL